MKKTSLTKRIKDYEEEYIGKNENVNMNNGCYLNDITTTSMRSYSSDIYNKINFI